MVFRVVVLLLLIGQGLVFSQKISVLASKPRWAQLDRYQKVITRAEFSDLLKIYAPGNAALGLIEVRDDHAVIRTGGDEKTMRLRFRSDKQALPKVPRFWRSKAELPGAAQSQPLRGLHLALDPGHLGGAFARMEERWFKIGEAKPVMEGEMTLLTAQILKPQLEKLGARVSMVRSSNAPVTRRRPRHFLKQARAELLRMGVTDPVMRYNPDWLPANRSRTLQWQSEKLFYRTSEIRARADRVNRRIRPDLVVCLHFNAEAWGDPSAPTLLNKNHLHVLVNGTYSAAELRFEDQRFEMLMRLLSGTYREEIGAAGAVATAMARTTGLPAFVYKTPNARRTTRNPYVYARNLLANRIYECPVIFLEPYVMNNRMIFARLQADHFDGERVIAGKMRPSLFAEYAKGVVDGLVRYYGTR